MLRGIHKLCEKGNWDDAIYDLRVDETARNAASIPGGWGEWTPLHLACRRNAPLELITELLKAAPIAAETFDLKDRLPIHYATEHGASIEILNALVQSCPESINGIDNAGHTPLHLSFLHSEAGKDDVRPFPTVEEVELLSDEEGTVAATADEAGNLPIHLAVNNIDQCSLDVLLTLICVDTKTLDKKNKDGLTPLHLALLNCAEKPISLDIVKALIGGAEDGEEEEANEVLKIADNNGRLPLHLACLNFEHIPLDVLKELLRGFGGAACVPMSDGSLPLDILEGLRHTVTRPQDVLDFNEKSDFIFAHHPDIEQYRNEPSRLGRISNRIKTELLANKCLSDESRMIWTWMCMLSEEEDKDKMHFITISQTLNSIRDDSLKRSLASIETVTEDGSILPLNACVSERVAILLKRCLLFADRYELLTRDIERAEGWCKIKALDWEDSNDQRTVVIKFMKNRNEFVHESNLRSKLTSSAGPSVIPMIECFNVGRLGTGVETSGDAKYEYDISKGDNPGGVDLSQYPCAIVLQEYGASLSAVLKERITGASMETILTFATDISDAVRRLHSCGLSHGGIGASSFVQMGSKYLVFESLRSASVMQDTDSSRKEYIGEASCISTGFLPPEMFVKLSEDDVKVYMKYWNTFAGDADIKVLLKSDDTRKSVANKVNSFLGGDNGPKFSDLWARVTSNAELWDKIRPRKIGDSYYAIRAYHRSVRSGKPVHPEKLPYELRKTDARQDTWTLGLLLYEIMTGEVMFRTAKSGDIEEDSSFATLCEWDLSGQFEQEKLAKVCNPVARDLLRTLLSSSMRYDMDDVRHHAFFGNNEVESRQQALKILKRDKHVRIQRDVMIEKENRLKRRTKELAFVPKDIQVKLEHSTWTQWDELDAAPTVPTSFVLLPYELETDEISKLQTVSADDQKKALSYGQAVATFMHYTAFSRNISKRYGHEITKDCVSTKLWEYSELNKSTLKATEGNLLAICRGILTRVKNAEQVLSDIIRTVLPDVDHVLEAKKLVRGAVEGIVDVEICRDITDKAAVVEKAVQSLYCVANDSSNQLITTEQIVSEQLQKLTGKDTSLEEDIKKKTDVEMTLFRLVKEFSENPLAASRSILMKKIEDMLAFFSPKPGAHLYLIDDMTGYPVSSSAWPLKVSLTPEIVRILLPGMYLSFKSFCDSGVVPGLSSMIGLSSQAPPQNWISDMKWNKGGFDNISTEHELKTLHAVTAAGSRAGGAKSHQLKQLLSFLISNDPDTNFSGLARILCPNNQVLWTLRNDYDEEKPLKAHSIGAVSTVNIEFDMPQEVLSGSAGLEAPSVEKPKKDALIKPSKIKREKSASSESHPPVQPEVLIKVDETDAVENGLDLSEMPTQVNTQQTKVAKEQSERNDVDDVTVSTMNSQSVACQSLPPRNESRVTLTRPRGATRQDNIIGSSIHDEVTPKASLNRSSVSVAPLPLQKKALSGSPMIPRRAKNKSNTTPPILSSNNNENKRNRANVMRTSPGIGLYKKAVSNQKGPSTPLGTPVGRIVSRNMFNEGEDGGDDVSVISMSSNASASRKNSFRRFRAKK